MIAVVWTILTLAGGYLLFLIAQKLVHFFLRITGIAAYKLHEEIQRDETKQAIRETWDDTKATASKATSAVINKIKR